MIQAGDLHPTGEPPRLEAVFHGQGGLAGIDRDRLIEAYRSKGAS